MRTIKKMRKEYLPFNTDLPKMPSKANPEARNYKLIKRGITPGGRLYEVSQEWGERFVRLYSGEDTRLCIEESIFGEKALFTGHPGNSLCASAGWKGVPKRRANDMSHAHAEEMINIPFVLYEIMSWWKRAMTNSARFGLDDLYGESCYPTLKSNAIEGEMEDSHSVPHKQITIPLTLDPLKFSTDPSLRMPQIYLLASYVLYHHYLQYFGDAKTSEIVRNFKGYENQKETLRLLKKRRNEIVKEDLKAGLIEEATKTPHGNTPYDDRKKSWRECRILRIEEIIKRCWPINQGAMSGVSRSCAAFLTRLLMRILTASNDKVIVLGASVILSKMDWDHPDQEIVNFMPSRKYS